MQGVLDSLTQATRLLQLHTPLGTDMLVAECLRGEEALSQCYKLDVTALSSDPDIALKSLLGQPVLLELATSAGGITTPPRPFHGHVTAVAAIGADGALARYALTIGPWFAFLQHGRDSRIFQDKTVFDILDAVFARWSGAGTLVPDWRFDIADRDIYPVRSLTCQYQESDLAFAERLMADEGLFYYFEHAADPGGAALGRHTMVIADHNGAFVPAPQAVIRFTQPGAVMPQDSIDRWRMETNWQAAGVELAGWDYRARRVVPASASGTAGGGIVRDTPGAYPYAGGKQGERLAANQLQALNVARERHVGAGTVRTLAAGTTFTLHGQAQLDRADGDDARTFVAVRVVHLAHNNVTSGIRAGIEQRLGASALATLVEQEMSAGLHATGPGAGERPLYRNRIDAIRSNVPYRPVTVDGHGRQLRPRPTVRGQQSAIVVGPPGAPVHTDRDHRIKVQFHWQRGEQSHSRLGQVGAGDSGAPGTDATGVWLRVATPMAPVAGENWGAVALPRVGSEVLVDFIDGDIDRPVVIGSLYNGSGQIDAQHNQVAQGAGPATGNAPPWFPGLAGAHAHAAVLSGFKSHALADSQAGSGAYSQLLFDDSAAEARVALQRHAVAHAGTDELNLGHLRHQADNQRLQGAGFGAELQTAHGAALRAGQGMLLTADARHEGAGHQLDSREASAQVGRSAQLQLELAQTAQQHNALLKAGDSQPGPEKLPAQSQLAATAEGLDGQSSGSEGDGANGGLGSAAAYDVPQLQLSAPAGIAAVTPASALLAAGGSSSLAAGQDINFAAQGASSSVVRQGIVLFSYGKAASADKPNRETGIRLHAATGKLSLQSQSGSTAVTADKAITVASTAKSIAVSGKEHVMLTAQGAYLKIEGGNIMLHGPGTISFKASMKELGGPASSTLATPQLPLGELAPNELVLERFYHDDEPLAGAPFEAVFGDGTVIRGTLDGNGRARLKNVPPGSAEVRYGAMPGQYARKDLQPTPEAKPRPSQDDIERLIDKYAAGTAPQEKDNP